MTVLHQRLSLFAIFIILSLRSLDAIASYSVRLLEGSSQLEGRVEVYIDGEWGTVCDDSWDDNDAMVVCRQLGYLGPAVAKKSAYFGLGRGDILLDDVNCAGIETNIAQCQATKHANCLHTEDAGVICSEAIEETIAMQYTIRLEEGSSDQEGRVEVFLNGEWGTVCDDQWDDRDAAVVCRQLGYLGPAVAKTAAFFGEGVGDILLDDVACLGSESNLGQCLVSPIVHNCGHSEDAGVICSGAETTVEYTIRLRGGDSSLNGRVEVLIQGAWGTVCDDDWDDRDAEVVCRQLGFEGPALSKVSAPFGEGSGDIVLDNVACLGSETNLGHCEALTSVYNCGHNEDAGVICRNGDEGLEGAVRLVGGPSSFAGTVEIFFNGEWGTVCDDWWGLSDATVVCRQLGFARASNFLTKAFYGEGGGRIAISDVGCLGKENRLLDCSYQEKDCSHSEDAGVECVLPKYGDVRLVDGGSHAEGRVEIYITEHWQTICDKRWSISRADIVCQQLGFRGADSAQFGSYFRGGTGPIRSGNFLCSSNDVRLIDCSYIVLQNDIDSCSHERDAGVKCSTGLAGGTIAGIVIGCIAGAFLLCLCWCCCTSSEKKQQSGTTSSPQVPVSNGARTTVEYAPVSQETPVIVHPPSVAHYTPAQGNDAPNSAPDSYQEPPPPKYAEVVSQPLAYPKVPPEPGQYPLPGQSQAPVPYPEAVQPSAPYLPPGHTLTMPYPPPSQQYPLSSESGASAPPYSQLNT